jgi:4-hydroxy-4-methyl-2-oxoglutarate aldolase
MSLSNSVSVLVIPRERRRWVAQKAEKRHADEDGKRHMHAAGVLGLDMYNMREPLGEGRINLRRQP